MLNSSFSQSLGQVGRVVKVFPTGDVRVVVNGRTWTYNPHCIAHAPGENPPEALRMLLLVIFPVALNRPVLNGGREDSLKYMYISIVIKPLI